MSDPVRIVAEICGNHQGNFETAVEMVRMAKICGCDVAKFQKRDCDLAVPEHMKNKPHPCPMHAFGETYLEHRKNLEFSLQQHRELQKICHQIGIEYSCSVWDESAACDIISLKPPFIKIPSAANRSGLLLDLILNANDFDGDVHISLGMSTRQERKEILDRLKPHYDRTVFYWTTSEYPVPFDRLYLLEIAELKKRVPRVGFSGHHKGISIDMASVVLGATWIERHFTLDRTWRGTDQSNSLEPEGMQKLVRDVKAVRQALTLKDCDITTVEKETRYKLSRN
jgi:N-acetylneuraminate synthase